jgi:hypothetical protein
MNIRVGSAESSQAESFTHRIDKPLERGMENSEPPVSSLEMNTPQALEQLPGSVPVPDQKAAVVPNPKKALSELV